MTVESLLGDLPSHIFHAGNEYQLYIKKEKEGWSVEYCHIPKTIPTISSQATENVQFSMQTIPLFVTKLGVQILFKTTCNSLTSCLKTLKLQLQKTTNGLV